MIETEPNYGMMNNSVKMDSYSKVEKSIKKKFTKLNLLVNLVQNESMSDELKSKYFDRIGAIILEVKARKDSINL